MPYHTWILECLLINNNVLLVLVTYKLAQNLVENYKCLISHTVSEGWNLEAAWLCGLAQEILWGYSQAFTWGCVLLRLDWGWRICFQGDLCTWLMAGGLFLACCWQDMLSSLPQGRLRRLLECSHNMAANFFQRSDPREGKEEFAVPFMTYSWSHTLSLPLC